MLGLEIFDLLNLILHLLFLFVFDRDCGIYSFTIVLHGLWLGFNHWHRTVLRLNIYRRSLRWFSLYFDRRNRLLLWFCLRDRSRRCLSFNWGRIRNNWRLIAWRSDNRVSLYFKRCLLLCHLLVLNLNHRKWLDFDYRLGIIELLFADSFFWDWLSGRNWVTLRLTLDFRLWLGSIFGLSDLLDLDLSRFS